MPRGIEEIEAEMMQRQCRRVQDFRYALQKFRKDWENFATIEKISQSLRNFIMHNFSLL